MIKTTRVIIIITVIKIAMITATMLIELSATDVIITAVVNSTAAVINTTQNIY